MSFIAVLCVFACSIWMIPVARSGRLLLIALSVLGVGTVLGPNFFAMEGPIQFSIDRILFFGMIAMALIGLRLGTTRLPRMNRMDWLMLGILGWFGLSALTGGGDPPGTPPIARWLFYVAMPAGIYFVARMVTIKTEDVRWLLLGMLSLGVYLAVTAVLELRGLHGLVFPRYIVDPGVWEFFGRGRGPLMNPSGNGFVISIALGASVICLIQQHRERRLFYGVLAVTLLTGVYATLTRSAWLGGFATIAVIGFIHAPRWVRVFGLSVVLLMVGIASTSLKEEFFRLKRDQNLSAADAEKSVKLRPLLAVVAWEMFQDRPLFGHGYGHYFAKHAPYHDDRGYEMPLSQARPYAQHNVFLSVLVDTGLVGFVLFSSWFLMVAAAAWRLARDGSSGPEKRAVGLIMLGTVVAYVCNGMFQDTMIIPMVHMFLFFLAGMTNTVLQTGVEAGTASSHRSPANAAEPPRENRRAKNADGHWKRRVWSPMDRNPLPEPDRHAP